MSLTLPLVGLRILVTRSRNQAGELSSRLSKLGAEPIEIPVLEIEPPDSWEPLDAALDQVAEYDWIIFASTNAVDSFVDRFESFGRTVDELVKIKFGAIGPTTADALVERGIAPAYHPDQFIAEALVQQFPGYPNLKGKRILWPRTNVGRTYISDKLTEAGAAVDIVQAYKTSDPKDPDAAASRIVNLLAARQLDVITLASSQSAGNLAKLIARGLAAAGEKSAGLTIGRLLLDVKIATIGPQTADAAQRALGKADIEATRHTIGGLVDAIVNHFAAVKH